MDPEKKWYERHRLQVRLIQYIIYHLKKEGYTMERIKDRKSRPQIKKAEIIDEPIIVSFD